MDRGKDPGEATRALGRRSQGPQRITAVRDRRWRLRSGSTLQTQRVVAATARRIGRGPLLGHLGHVDAIDRAGRETEVAAGATVGKDMVLMPGSADDGVDRTGADALGATDAAAVVDARDAARRPGPAGGVQGDLRYLEEIRQCPQHDLATGWAPVDRRSSVDDGLRIRSAALKAAAAALRLGKKAIDLFATCLGSRSFSLPWPFSLPFACATWLHRR